jgi:hypothetical protein
MLEEALPLAVGVGAALLPAMAFGGLAAARAFMYLGAGEGFRRLCVCFWGGGAWVRQQRNGLWWPGSSTCLHVPGRR